MATETRLFIFRHIMFYYFFYVNDFEFFYLFLLLFDYFFFQFYFFVICILSACFFYRNFLIRINQMKAFSILQLYSYLFIFFRFCLMWALKKIVRRKKLFLWDTSCIRCLCVPWAD